MRRRTFLAGVAGVAGVAGGLGGVVPFGRSTPAAGALEPSVVESPSALELADQVGSELGRAAHRAMALENTIVYSVSQQRVWLLRTGVVQVRRYPVSGRFGNPPPGVYRVYSKSPTSFSTNNPAVRWKYMVRFYVTPRGNNIGFHQIPVRCNSAGVCTPLQSESELGSPRSSGCVRQSAGDAQFLYSWAPLGQLVIVTR